MRLIKSLAGAALAVLLLAVPAQAQIKIGVFPPLSGAYSTGGELELAGVKLGIQEMPEVLGQKIELVVVDNKSDRAEAAKAVKRLIEEDKVVALIGAYSSGLAIAGGEVAEAAKVPLVGTTTTNPLVTKDKEYSFRACFIDPYQGAGAATYAVQTLKAKKAALFVEEDSEYAKGLAIFFVRSFTKLGGEIVGERKYKSGDQDFKAQLAEIAGLNPDLLFMPAFANEGALIMKQAQELGATFNLMGGDGLDSPEIIEMAKEIGGTIFHTTFPYDPDMPAMNDQAKAFTAAWEKTHPDQAPNSFSAMSYTAYAMVIDAIKRAGSADPQAIAAALAKTKDLPTPVGLITLDEDRNPSLPVGIVEIKSGERRYIGEAKPE